jgi:hypothetical protein
MQNHSFDSPFRDSMPAFFHILSMKKGPILPF